MNVLSMIFVMNTHMTFPYEMFTWWVLQDVTKHSGLHVVLFHIEVPSVHGLRRCCYMSMCV